VKVGPKDRICVQWTWMFVAARSRIAQRPSCCQ